MFPESRATLSHNSPNRLRNIADLDNAKGNIEGENISPLRFFLSCCDTAFLLQTGRATGRTLNA
jgi:hypothetical protein